MSKFTENRITLIGNQEIAEEMLKLHKQFKADKGNFETAVGRILYGYKDWAAQLTGTAIRGGRSITYLDESKSRHSNGISFVVSNSNANLVQEQLLMLFSHLDPHLIVSNEISDEYYQRAYYRYILLDRGYLEEYVSYEDLPDGKYHTVAGQKKLATIQKRVQLNAFNKLKSGQSWVDNSMYLPTFIE